MSIYEVRLATNVAPFSYSEVADVNNVDTNFLPDWKFHLVIDSIPEGLDVREFCLFMDATDDYECISNPMVLVDLMGEIYEED